MKRRTPISARTDTLFPYTSSSDLAAKDGSYIETEPNQIVIDYLASMTDDYCTELYEYLFPKSSVKFKYHGYFEDLM
jgi:dGTPase